MNDAIADFSAAMQRRGIVPPANLIADGKIHRCNAIGRGGKDDGAYLLFPDGIPAGGFENWRDGLGWENWRAESDHTLTPEEEAGNRVKIEAARKEREAEEAKRKAEARKRARKILEHASPCAEHPYLSRKGIKAHGARLNQGCLVLPVRDVAGELHSLQFIAGDGSKKFLKGGRKHGCHFLIGEPNGVLCIVEGFATGASIHEATGHAVAVAFDAGNLSPVAKAFRQKFPDLRLILCADDDFQTEGNPGRTKAIEAAHAVGAPIAQPDFGPERPERATDFNDLHQTQGVGAVRRCIEITMDGQPDEPSTPQDTDSDIAGRSSSGNRCPYGGGHFEKAKDGISFIGTDKDGNDQPPRWISSRLDVIAMTRDANSAAWGRLLEWRDDDGVIHRWAMPMELLQSDGADMRRELAQFGLFIAPSKTARDLLASYVQVWPVKDRARCVERLGWHGGVYVTPSESIGEAGEIVVFQNAHAIEPALSVAGTVGQWRDTVAALAKGNSRLVCAISVAFAGALAEIAGEDSGGFHFRGNSSTGKTTILKVAASVWGDPSAYPRLWRATANGLEGLAALHNDGVLILDELGQIDPKEAGEAAYLLANGQGKARASRTGAARQAARWRLLFLSAGEASLTALMAQAGKRASAGQEIRLADIEADAGAGMGAFETLHDLETPAALATALKEAATRFHGSVGIGWLRCVASDRPTLADLIGDGIRQFVDEVVPKDASGQVQRVARRFALVASAGELATHYGLTGWQGGEAESAAKKCFAAWLDSFGGVGNREERAMLAQVRAFFEQHGASRFEPINAGGDGARIINRAGFYRDGPDSNREFLVLPEAFRQEVCKGLDTKAAVMALCAHGWIDRGGDGKPQQKPRLPGLGSTRCYVFTSRMWEEVE